MSSFKIIIVGDSSVGKTSLINRYCSQTFTHSIASTIGVDYMLKDIKYDGNHVKLQIWDTAGQERYVNMTKSFFRRVNAVIFMFSIIDQNSFRNVSKWMKIAFGEIDENVTKLLVGTKMDLYQQRKISIQDAKEAANKYGMNYVEVSAKLDYNIESMFQGVAKELISNIQKSETHGQKRQMAKLKGIFKGRKNCIC